MEVTVVSVMLLHNFYNVETAQVLQLHDTSGNGNTFTFDIPPGFYLVDDILDIMNKDTTFSATWVASMNQRTSRFRVQVLNAGDYGNVTIALDTAANTPQIRYMLGLQDHTDALENELLAEDQVEFYGLREVYLRSNELGGNSRIPGWASGDNNILLRVPLDVNYGDILYYEPNIAGTVDNGRTDISALNLDFLDSNGQPLDMNSANWSVSLLVTVRRRVADGAPISIRQTPSRSSHTDPLQTIGMKRHRI
jgi:hypothetical protein